MQEKKEAKRARKMGEVDESEHKDGDDLGTDVGGFEVVPSSAPSAFERPEDPQELAETLALGSLLTSKKSRMELINHLNLSALTSSLRDNLRSSLALYCCIGYFLLSVTS
mmetsp:Transcript_19772/g.16518  ORF Transcript_19772/g.16518 Transcript_19772/m.16518 type:complete len:110 (-) Transcript_19772:117-446(-)